MSESATTGGGGRKKAAKTKAEEPGFDQSLERLEAIVAELEQGGGGLESSLEQYREGVALLKGCRDKLAGFRAQVEELSAEGVKPYAGDPDVGESDRGLPGDLDAPF